MVGSREPVRPLRGNEDTTKACLKAFTVLLYILILTVQNVSGYYGLHFTAGEIRVERVKNRAQKLKSRKRWKQEVAV